MKANMTQAEAESTFGISLENDDLDRINCHQVGDTGHYMCGVCEMHNAPRFQCGCSVRVQRVRY